MVGVVVGVDVGVVVGVVVIVVVCEVVGANHILLRDYGLIVICAINCIKNSM